MVVRVAVVMIVRMMVMAAAGSVRVVVGGMPMLVHVTMVAVVVAAIVLVGAALGLERAHHRRRRAALPAHHLGQHRIVLDVEGVRRDLGRGVPVADVPRHPQETKRVLGPDFEQALRRGLDLDESPVLKLHSVAVVEDGRSLQVEQKVEHGRGGPVDVRCLFDVHRLLLHQPARRERVLVWRRNGE